MGIRFYFQKSIQNGIAVESDKINYALYISDIQSIIVCGEQIHVLFLTIVLLRLWLTGFIQFLKQYYKPERQVPFINLTIMQNKLKKWVVRRDGISSREETECI